MNPTGTSRLLAIAGVVVALVGAIDAVIGGEWDLFLLFIISLVIGILLLLRFESKRPAIPVRRDLVVWLRDRAAISGEPMSSVTDRAIASFSDRYGAVAEVDEVRQ